MNKIILLGNMTRNPKTTRKTAEDGSEVVITKFDLAVTGGQSVTERQMPISFTALPLEDRRNLSSGIFTAAPVY
mgnify:CR=1 FL=1